eukprot:m.206537 g.206537  ORF g.206537 m.206537 type:complete len:372 (-) comp15536_c25_seq5:20-1135(-)
MIAERRISVDRSLFAFSWRRRMRSRISSGVASRTGPLVSSLTAAAADEASGATAAAAAAAAGTGVGTATEAAEPSASLATEAASVAEAAAAAAAAATNTITKTKSKETTGGHVWIRNENLTLRVGPLPHGWEKKTDPTSGRPYYKNHETRQTTWVDPRSAAVRKQDAKDTVGDELPYGWDEAEINGESYFIDHNTKTTHWLHPRLLLETKREEYARRQEAMQSRAEDHRELLRAYRDKKRHLEELRATVADADELEDVDARISAIDIVILKELSELNAITKENEPLRQEIEALRAQFLRKTYEAQHGEGSFESQAQTQELYPTTHAAADTLPRLDTLAKNRLARRPSVNILPLDGIAEDTSPTATPARLQY